MKPILALFATFLASSAALHAQTTRTWTAGTSSTNFNGVSNYDPSGVLTINSQLVFDSATDPALTAGTSVALHGIGIGSGANGFRLGGVALTIGDGGISVAAGTSAVFDMRFSSHGDASNFTVDIGAGGTATVGGKITPLNRAFYKTGSGTLILAEGMGSTADNFLRSGTAIHIEEGTLEVGNAAVFQAGATLSILNIHLGTASTTGHLRGGGTFGGSAGKSARLTTYGTDRSIIEPAGDGTLFIQNLDATAGATFLFTLGSGLIEGNGTFTGSAAADELVLDLRGGEVGVEYTLFDYDVLSGVDESDFVILTTGYEVESWSFTNGQVQVSFSAIPEPGSVALGGLFVLGCGIAHCRRYLKK